MIHDLYLLYIPNQDWGVFDASSCPDTHRFPDYLFRQYDVLDEDRDGVFAKLKDIQGKLVRDKVVPNEDNQSDIFPELSDLIEGE